MAAEEKGRVTFIIIAIIMKSHFHRHVVVFAVEGEELVPEI